MGLHGSGFLRRSVRIRLTDPGPDFILHDQQQLGRPMGHMPPSPSRATRACRIRHRWYTHEVYPQQVAPRVLPSFTSSFILPYQDLRQHWVLTRVASSNGVTLAFRPQDAEHESPPTAYKYPPSTRNPPIHPLLISRQRRLELLLRRVGTRRKTRRSLAELLRHHTLFVFLISEPPRKILVAGDFHHRGIHYGAGGARFLLSAIGFLLGNLKAYGLQPHNISPNSVLAISNHVTLCEGHLRVTPELPLFQYYFTVKKEKIRQTSELATCGSITFMLRPGRVYPHTDRHESARYWSGSFFYLKDVSDPASDRKLPLFKNSPASETPAWTQCPHLSELPQLTRAVRRICKLTE
ncbi:hypothetical protein QYE76_039805 [Lolium multiflorum]|uniref:Transposase (putative) gypsy type domain-containing protein n=1 Tax=Lolium multiflorum TaxID=4521 RepID=A0AAD8TBS0_LOLMU|nr:hypothetical protein QYE76_039805 [Lolium multiflorum]